MSVLRGARTRASCLHRSWITPIHHQSSRRSLYWVAPNTSVFAISQEVRNAVASGKPVVALETAIYTHGFPYPENVALASELEAAIRAEGVIPASIGIIDGVSKVGLSSDELLKLCQTPRHELMKVSRRDLSFLSGFQYNGKAGFSTVKKSGGTTVAGTMVLAHKAGIKIFATGGIGGVHRGAGTTFDVSADLVELGRTPVAVICSGCKSFLDVPKTIEYLETQGVAVATFTRDESHGEFPGFWSVRSGVKSPALMLSPIDPPGAYPTAAAHAICRFLSSPVCLVALSKLITIDTHTGLGLTSGMLFANPVPQKFEIPKDQMDIFIKEAVHEAELEGVAGRDNTPYILGRIKELSQGRSVEANRELVLHNARCASIIAQTLHKKFRPWQQLLEYNNSQLTSSREPEKRSQTAE
jgi:pseudouridine-5'-phosphate glycosidase/pseudouridine kinase